MSLLSSIARPVIAKTSRQLSARSCSRLNNIAVRSMAGTAESRTSAVSNDLRHGGSDCWLGTRIRRGCIGSFFGCFVFFFFRSFFRQLDFLTQRRLSPLLSSFNSTITAEHQHCNLLFTMNGFGISSDGYLVPFFPSTYLFQSALNQNLFDNATIQFIRSSSTDIL